MSQRFLTRALPFFGVLALLLALYLPTLQRIPNGSDHYYMIDVGETQVVLNVWGTLHATGYPLYVMTGSALVAILKALGVSAATAPALVSLLWGVLALALLYVLALQLFESAALASALVVLFGLTRSVWVHMVIAEIYTFGLMILALLLVLALWPGRIRGRVYWLALAGGIGVAHHRALAMAAPALVFAVWPELYEKPRAIPRKLALAVALALAGFVPYAYLPLRALADAAWVYGEPGTWQGFWDQFFGREASRFIGPPNSAAGLMANIGLVNGVLERELAGGWLMWLGVAGLLAGVWKPQTRRGALTLLLTGLVAYVFHVAFYTDILSALILPVTLSLAFGVIFLLRTALGVLQRVAISARRWRRGVEAAAAAAIIGAVVFALTPDNRQFVVSLTGDETGLETIALAENAPAGSTVMLAWGPRHFAVGFARDVLGELLDIRLASHKADFAALAAAGPLVTPEYTFYNQPLSWWEARLGGKVYLRAAAPYLVEIGMTPERADAEALGSQEARVLCHEDQIVLDVTWASPETPTEDLSVFVHLVDEGGNVVAQADQSAPVYGWRPLTTWAAQEAVRDLYPLPRIPGATWIRYGLYRQVGDGRFENVLEYAAPVECSE